ncbi:hypothetical protein GCM10010123_01300 [Pilimelia anulata]|uniref:DUF6036 domain-containing protein n=1 Tax=Pilimelia anulata TaxID=53371 RepID=A0A8J3B2B9_9ACTN|nr:DUF6036 family nucleotidyltransferase [Pilimelia anulata]GGJ75047.1 hypothetical protein GCM10010123_01300 [Pilimelia anulata]
MTLLSRAELVSLLEEVGAELAGRGLRGDVFVVGGAALALAYNVRRSTRDLDAVFEPKQVVYEAARVVGARRGLPADWLNDAVKGFLPGADPNATTLFERAGLTVRVASAPYLFAMKAAAARVERDSQDILYLYRMCGFSSVDEALACVEQYYPAHVLPAKAGFLLRELLDPAADL